MTTNVPIDVRIARLAAKLSPDEADDLLRSWNMYRAMYSNEELEDMYLEPGDE